MRRAEPAAALGFTIAVCAESQPVEIDAAFADQFASEWVQGWNAHDLPSALAHYNENVELSSPLIIQRGMLIGSMSASSLSGGTLRKALDQRVAFRNRCDAAPRPRPAADSMH